VPLAVVFPGQGSQAPGFGLPWTDHPASALVAEAEAAADRPLRHLLVDPDADLAPTDAAQLSVLLGSLVAWRALRDAGIEEPVAMAGHSLGQITALVAAEAVDLAAGIRLAVARADATAAAQAREPGAMLALLGADEDRARRACAAAPGAAWPANLNGAGQVVVGGRPEALDAVARAAADAGVRRTRRLAVDGAFHTPLMQPAADALAPVLAATAFAAPAVPIVTNHDARPVDGADGWPERLGTHLVSPVRWEDVVRRLVGLGADTIVEVGPGTTLAGLVRRIAPEVTVRNVATPAEAAAVAEAHRPAALAGPGRAAR